MQEISKKHHDYYKMEREILVWSFIIIGFLLIVISFPISVGVQQEILRSLGLSLTLVGLVTLILSRYAGYFTASHVRESISATIVTPPIAILFILISSTSSAQPTIIDHNSTDITKIPQIAIEQAKINLHIAYGHTSHGSQLTTGMTGLVETIVLQTIKFFMISIILNALTLMESILEISLLMMAVIMTQIIVDP